ncbi:MAG TPA: DUF2905 domain-containing protein [Gemmatimonadales bacterium]|nr:DUF2905 domain-containing protein [Gemmatimonadales bacterium]
MRPGPLLVALGLALVVLGLAVWAGLLHWFGRLPGDLRFERPGVRVYFPLASMLVVSLLASLIAWLVRRFTGGS